MSELVNRVRIGSAIDKELYSKLKELSNETMIPMSRLLDRAIELVLVEYDKSTKQ